MEAKDRRSRSARRLFAPISAGRRLKPVVVLTGPLKAGKTTLALGLADELPAKLIRARQILRTLAGRELSTRQALQSFGAEVEAKTSGAWLADFVTDRHSQDPLIIDSARTGQQVAALRKTFPSVSIIHLTATSEERRRRLEMTRDLADCSASENTVETMSHPLEVTADAVAEDADLVIDTTALEPDAVLRRALAELQAKKRRGE